MTQADHVPVDQNPEPCTQRNEPIGLKHSIVMNTAEVHDLIIVVI